MKRRIVRFAPKIHFSLMLGLLLVACSAPPTPTPNRLLPIPAPTSTLACAPLVATSTAAPTSASSHPAAGSLDPTFGKGGIVLTYPEEGAALAIQADGKIVTAGTTPRVYSPLSSFVLHRYNPDGSPDCTFGDGGTVLTNPYGDRHDVGASAVTVQFDGKIVAVGSVSHHLALVRYRTDGSVDPTFGSDGQIETSITGSDRALSIATQPDAKIVVGGNTYPDNLLLVRYNGDGSLDSTFGNDGVVNTDMNRHGDARAVMIQTDSKIVVVGSGNSNVKMFNFAVLRYNMNGSLDPTFGNGGIVLTPLGKDYDGANALAIQPDGKIVVAGQSSIVRGRSTLALLRYNTDGSLDPSFGSGGKAIDYLTDSDTASGVAIQSEGKIVVSGITFRAEHIAGLLLVRYNSDGSLDSTFGSGGKVITSVGSNSGVSAMAIQADGKIVVAGNTDVRPLTSGGESCLPPKCSYSSSLLLLRYLP